jgi:hypothetical protein
MDAGEWSQRRHPPRGTRLRADARGRNGGIREELAKGVGHVIEKRRRRPDSSVLRYLRNIEAKLDRINERLDKFLSAPKTKSKQAAHIPQRVKVFGTREAAKKYLKKHPADPGDDVMIIITGVPGLLDILQLPRNRGNDI